MRNPATCLCEQRAMLWVFAIRYLLWNEQLWASGMLWLHPNVLSSSCALVVFKFSDGVFPTSLLSAVRAAAHRSSARSDGRRGVSHPAPGVGHRPSGCGEPAGALTKGPTHPERGHSSTSPKQAVWMQPQGLGGCRLFPGLFPDLFYLLTDTSHTVQNEI